MAVGAHELRCCGKLERAGRVAETEAVKEIESQLAKSPRRAAAPRPKPVLKAKPKATISTRTATIPPWRTKRRKLRLQSLK